MDENKKSSSGLVISEEVIAKIASVAATDVAGVAGMVVKPANINGLFRKDGAAKAVRVNLADSGTSIDVFIALCYGAKMTTVAEEVQQSVKEAVQNMTGGVVHKVNVFVEDIDLTPPAQEQ